MNAISTQLPTRWLLLALLCLPIVAAPSFAADALHASMTLHANFIMDLVSDRARLIQVSLVAVVLGCSLLWWRR